MADTIALVTPWFGPNLTGGAEVLARQVALALAERGHSVEILTTCSRAFDSDWGRNYHRPGIENDGPLRVRRFAVDARDAEAFQWANTRLLVQYMNGETSDTFVRENIHSRGLCEHLQGDVADYRAVLFLPYLYGPILRGIPLAGAKAFLQPLLHDEPYALLPQVEEIVHAARGLLFSSEGELRLARRLYGPGISDKSTIVGHWIDAPPESSGPAQRIGPLDPSRERYLLYLGRRDDTKNVGLLVEAFRSYRRRDRVVDLKLVLAGPGATSFDDPHDGIVDLGFVTEAQKYDLLRNTLALCQPSVNESFSRAMLEAWSCARPVAVNAYCLSTSLAVERAGGGWMAAAKDEWAQVFHEIDYAGRDALAAMGARGYEYYLQNATKSSVLDRYEEALGIKEARHSNGSVSLNGKTSRPGVWDIMPDMQLLRQLRDGRYNILFAGRLEAESWCDDLITAFSFLLAMQCDARLSLIDTAPASDQSRKLQRMVELHGLSERVRIVTDCTFPQAAAYYRTAALFWSLSNVDGDFNGLVDALWFDVPILAYASPAVRELLGPAGILVNDAQDGPHLGALAKTLLHDADLRGRVLRAQRERRDTLHDHAQERERVS